MQVRKRKRVSKKKKISWRKHVDITDVEHFLEEQRLQERLGKPVSEKTNQELFQIDNDPSTRQPELTTKQKQRMILRSQLPKCYSMLQPHSEVPDPLIKRNRVRTKEERKNKLVKRIEDDRRRRGILKAKELQSRNDKKLDIIKRATKPKSIEFKEDIWDSKDPNKQIVSNEWISNNTRKHTLNGIGKLLKVVPKTLQKKESILPKIEVPHPGTSYNPRYDDHQELLKQIVDKEVKIIKAENHLIRVTRGMYSKVTPEERDKNWLTEMSQGLEKREKTEVEDDTEEYKAVNPPVKNKKKNLKQKRKKKEQQQLEQLKQKSKKEKKKIADIHKLKFLKSNIDKIEKKATVQKLKRLKKQTDKLKETKRLSLRKFEEPEEVCNMPQDIKGNLRNLKKEGSLLHDRFKSLQKRNILQPTTKQVRKRAPVKRFQRQGHKDDWKSTVAKAT